MVSTIGERLGLERLRERGRWKGDRRPPLAGETVVEESPMAVNEEVDGLELRGGG